MRTGTFALFCGIVFLSIGMLGLIPAILQPAPADAPPTQVTMLYGYLLGLFPVNVLHSAVHLSVGVWGIAAGRYVAHPKLFARVLAVAYALLAVLGLIPGANTLFGLLPLHGHDVWLHAGTAAIAAYFGWRTQADTERRNAAVADRREHVEPVEHERRYGHGDRRIPTSE